MMSAAAETKATVCGTCHQRSCCYHYKVMLTGYDLWRIGSTLDIPPSQFVAYTEAEAESIEAFILDQSGSRWDLVLAKTVEPRLHGGCIFLMKTNDGTHRCGLGDLKPDQCRIYPVYFQEGLIRVINDSGGCWRTWSVIEVDIEDESRRNKDYEQHRAAYRQIISAWNERVWQCPDRSFSFHEFCNYLENRYAALFPQVTGSVE